MANVNAPNGFQQYFGGSGGVPTFNQSVRRVASNAAAIYNGDPVMPVISSATGYIVVGSPATTVIAGIFAGCKYLSTSQKRTVWSNYWPGSDATGDVEAYVIDDPNAQFLVQGASTTFNITGTPTTMTSSPIGQYAQFAIGTPSAVTGMSGAYLNTLGTTVTYPFIVRGLLGLGADYNAAGNGSDPTTAYNKVIVGFNNEWLRTNGAGPLGIS